MTIPWQMNCKHMAGGWCLGCVHRLGEKAQRYRATLEEIEQTGHNPADLAPDLIGKTDRWELLATRLADTAHAALADHDATPPTVRLTDFEA